MREKTKLYFTVVIALAVITIIISLILNSDFSSETIGSADTSAAKNSMSAEDLDQLLGESLSEDETDDFVNTEGNSGEEMVVDEEVFESMPSVEQELSQDKLETTNIEASGSSEQVDIPEEINLEVTFYPQAPEADWSLPWKEACEEASIIQAYYYVKGQTLSKETFKNEILSIVDVQENILGKFIDTSMSETAQFLEEYYDYTYYEIIDNPSIDDMKIELAQGHPIIAPFAGKELGNGFFTNGGPRYHVLVIVGYKDGFFITNDVGTSRGENFAYSYETIMNAMHDLVPNGEGDILNGDKKILVMR